MLAGPFARISHASWWLYVGRPTQLPPCDVVHGPEVTENSPPVAAAAPAEQSALSVPTAGTQRYCVRNAAQRSKSCTSGCAHRSTACRLYCRHRILHRWRSGTSCSNHRQLAAAVAVGGGLGLSRSARRCSQRRTCNVNCSGRTAPSSAHVRSRSSSGRGSSKGSSGRRCCNNLIRAIIECDRELGESRAITARGVWYSPFRELESSRHWPA